MTRWRKRSSGNLHTSTKLYKHTKALSFPTLTAKFEFNSRLMTSFEKSSEMIALKWKVLPLIKDECFRIIYSGLHCVCLLCVCVACMPSSKNITMYSLILMSFPLSLPVTGNYFTCLLVLTVLLSCRFCVCVCVWVHRCLINTMFSLTSPGKPCPLRRCSEPWESSLPKWRRTSSSL